MSRLSRGLTGATSIALFISSASAASPQVGNSGKRLAFQNGESLTSLTSLVSDRGEFFESPSASAHLEEISAANGTTRSTLGSSSITANDLRLSDYEQRVFTTAPGSTVTLNLQNFVLRDHSTLSIFGDATATLIFNVTNQFSLSQSSKIVLSGGIQWNHVFFNVLGTGSVVSSRGSSVLSGTLTASQRSVRLSGQAIVYGNVLARRIVVRQAAQIITPPIVSQ